MSVLRALVLAWRDLLRPRILGVVALGVGLTLLLFVALQAAAFWAIRAISKGEGDSVAVPVSNNNLSTNVGSAVEWDPVKAQQLFDDLNNNRPLSIDPSQE